MVAAQAEVTRAVILFQAAVRVGVEVGLHRKVLAVPLDAALPAFQGLV
jgi:hypothetical protein